MVDQSQSVPDTARIVDGLAESGLTDLLEDAEVKKFLLAEIKEIGVPAPFHHLVYRLIKAVSGKSQSFLGVAVSSRLDAFLQRFPKLVGLFQRILNIQHGEAAKGEFKAKLLDAIHNGKPADTSEITVDETTDLELMLALHSNQNFSHILVKLESNASELTEVIRAELKDLFHQITRPELSWPREIINKEELNGLERLKYTSGIDALVGRAAEIEFLRRFEGDPSMTGTIFNFRWLLITGEGGEGKTRLAYDFTNLHLNSNIWEAGKLDQAAMENFVNALKWRPQRPTFMVVDYAQTMPAEVGRLLEAFTRNALHFDFPVRLLILERRADDSWVDQMIPSGGSKSSIMSHCFDRKRTWEREQKGYQLLPLEPEAIIQLMQQRFERSKVASPEPGELIEAASKVDPRAVSIQKNGEAINLIAPRALFALATAEALLRSMTDNAEHDTALFIQTLQREDVLRDIIARERGERWAAHSKPKELRRYETLLALATFVQGINMTQLEEIASKRLRKWLPKRPPNHNEMIVAAMGGRSVFLPQVEPDILGEFFVLEIITRPDFRLAVLDFTRTALMIGGIDAVIFVLRLLQDFPSRFGEIKLWDLVDDNPDEEMAGLLVILFSNMPGLLHGKLGMELVERLSNSFLNLQRAFPENEKIALREAQSAVDLSIHARIERDFARVDELQARLSALQQAFPENERIALKEVQSASNLSIYAQNDGDFARVDELLLRMSALQKIFPENEEIALIEAQSAVHGIIDAQKEGVFARVDELQARLSALQQAFPENEEIALEEAKSAYNVSYYAQAVGVFARVAELQARLSVLQQAFPENEEIALIEAKSVFNFSVGAQESGDVVRLDELLARLNILQQAFPENEEIALEEAKSAYNRSDHAHAAGDTARVDELHERLSALQQAFPKNGEIALVEARSAYNLSLDARESGDVARVDELHARLRALQRAFPENEEIALREAKSAFNVSNYARKAGDVDRAEELHTRLNALQQAFPENEEIALEEANSAFNLSIYAQRAGDVARVDELLARLSALQQAFPENEEIALIEANSAYSGGNYSHAAGDSDTARVDELLARLSALQRAFPENGEIALIEAKSVFNLSLDAQKSGDVVRMDELLARLGILQQAFPGNEEIALEEAKSAFNVSNYAHAAGDVVRVDELQARLSALQQAFPGNEEIALIELTSAYNVSLDARKAGDVTRVDELQKRMSALQTVFPENETIALIELNSALNVSFDARKAGDVMRVDELHERMSALYLAFPESEEIALIEAKSASNLSLDAQAAGNVARVDELQVRLKALQQVFPENEEIASILDMAKKLGD